MSEPTETDCAHEHHHCFVRLIGYGLAILPYQPYVIVRSLAEGTPALDITQGPQFARVITDNGGYRSLIDQNTASLYDVCDIQAAEELGDWRLETSRFSLSFPAGCTLHSSPYPQDPRLLTLVSTDDHIYYLQDATIEFSASRLQAPGQRLIAEGLTDGHRYLEYRYSHDGLGYRQRHVLVEPISEGRGIVLTGQALDWAHEEAWQLLNELVLSVVWTGSPPK